jgi:hypothetical protein
MKFFHKPVFQTSPFDWTSTYMQLIKSMFCLLFLITPSLAEGNIPCSIKMMFTHDDYGSAAEYHLTAQVTNRTGRPVIAVSTLFYDGQSKLLGNTELDCLNGRPSLNSGSTGQCSVLLQTIDGKMMEKFGTTTWTEIVNFQLKKLDSIAECKIEGFRYKNTD